MKTRFALINLLLFGYMIVAIGQEADESYKRDLGFNTSIILDNIFESSQTPFSLMNKKYTADNKAWRFGATALVSVNDADGDGYLTTNDRFNVTLVLGKEKLEHISKSWVWYYGMDILPAISYNNTQTHVNDEKIAEVDMRTVSLSARPFIGIRFNISPRLYLSTETNLSASFTHRKTKRENFNPYTLVEDYKENLFNLTMSPATGIFLFYRF